MASPPCLEILDRTRASLIFAAIILRKPTIMSENKWKHIPWSLHPDQINSIKLLFDIVADYPQLFILRDKLLSVADEDIRTAGARSLSQQCLEVIAKLENWRETFASDPFHTSYETPACQPVPLIADEYGALHPAWSTTYRYRSLYHANAITVYNAATIMALRFADSIDAEWVSSSDWHIRQEQITTAALTICRSVEYHQLEDWGEQGPFELLFPLRMAYDGISEKEPTIASWITSVMQDISAGRRGLWRSAKSILDVGK
ncbi:hypothetical protein J4E89_001635 [Alternaria sp. Ai002NY15]|nr:hypothetical protein J4E89_001635 [Alternaria sp. Ai002NY15]